MLSEYTKGSNFAAATAAFLEGRLRGEAEGPDDEQNKERIEGGKVNGRGERREGSEKRSSVRRCCRECEMYGYMVTMCIKRCDRMD